MAHSNDVTERWQSYRIDCFWSLTISASKKSFIFKTTLLILMQKDYTLFISVNSALYDILQCNRWPSTDWVDHTPETI